MSSLIAAATTAIVAALQAAPAVAPQVARVRLRALSASTTTAVVVRPQSAEVNQTLLSGGPVTWSCRVEVECYAKTAPAATSADASVDGLTQAVYERLMTDPTLGGAVNRIDPVGVSYDFDADGENTACATFVFNVRQIAADPHIF